MALPTVKARHHSALNGATGEELVSASVGPEGEVIALWAAAADLTALRATTTQPGWAQFPDPESPRPVTARVTVHAPTPVTAARLPGLRLAHVHVQPLPNGRILLVGARARWRPEGADRNAIIYDADGRVEAEETLGDGIEHIFATASGQVWVGYIDEGIYGNYGWGDSEQSEPIGTPGLIRFSSSLKPDWRFPSHVTNPWGAISDCYALNIDGETAWACYYTDFPIVRVHGGVLTGWHNADVEGAKALAVGGRRIALFGGYGAHRDRLVVGDLDAERLQVTGRYRVVLPGRRELPAGTTVIGRGADLHLLTGADWYRIGLDDIPQETGQAR